MISHYIYSMDRDAKWLAWFEQQFSNLAGSDRQIDLEEFKEALHVKEVRMIFKVMHDEMRWVKICSLTLLPQP